MNLKLVVASMSVLGLVSCPVFAATQAHHKHLRVVKQQRIVKQEVVQTAYKPDYKNEAIEPVCSVGSSTLVLESMTQNVGRALPNPCNPGWFNRIALSGGITVDIGKWGNRNAEYMGENYQRFSLNDAYINIAANVNDWTKAFASISYNTATINDPLFAVADNHVAEFDAAYSHNVISGSEYAVQLEQAFVTIGNFDVSPLFLQIGKQFQDFGRYPIHPITESMTEVMSKTLATSAKLGFIASGFNGSVYVFDDPLPKVGQSSRPTNYGAAIGYELPETCNMVGFDIGVAYLYNMIGVNDIAYNVNQFNIANLTPSPVLGGFPLGGGYHTRAGGVAFYGDLNFSPFYLGLRYTTAVQRFNVLDLPKYGIADINNIAGLTTPIGAPIPGAIAAKPWSLAVQAGFGFNWFFNLAQNLYVGYQTGRQISGLNLPKYRWLLGYDVEIWKSTNFGIEWDHDNAFSVAQGGIGRNTNLVSLRAGVKFS